MANTPALRLGSLFTGYGGLDLAVAEAFGPETIDLRWTADNAAGPKRIIAARYGEVPNLGDVREISYGDQAPDSVDLLTCGFPCQDVSEAGRRAGNQGQRTQLYRYAISAIAALRPALVIAENVRGILSAPGRTPARRAFGDVLADLSAIGYDASWASVPASAAGAPHQRTRVYVLGYPAATDARSEARDIRRRLRTSLETQQRRRRSLHDARTRGVEPSPDPRTRTLDWGRYAPAIERWSAHLRRAAPYPVCDTGRDGYKLEPSFVEWMMGLPAGYVTDVPDLTRGEQLKALGNGVVPQAGAIAIRTLLQRIPA